MEFRLRQSGEPKLRRWFSTDVESHPASLIRSKAKQRQGGPPNAAGRLLEAGCKACPRQMAVGIDSVYAGVLLAKLQNKKPQAFCFGVSFGNPRI